MRRKDVLAMVFIAIVAGFISMVIANTVFGPPKERNAKVPAVEKIDKTFPDTANDPTYNSFLNEQALDPTQPVQIGNNQNTKPFTQ